MNEKLLKPPLNAIVNNFKKKQEKKIIKKLFKLFERNNYI